MSRVHRSALNFATSISLSLATLLISLWATPRILSWLGDERMGAFRAMMDWLGYLALLELGLSGALMPLIAAALNRNEPQRLDALMAEGFRVYRRVAVLMLAGGFLIVLVIPRL